MKWEPGFSGKDSMRSKAESMFRDDIKAANKYEQPRSASSIGREKARPYAAGGHVKHHGMPKTQTDMKLPHREKTPKLKIQSFQAAEKMAHGGHSKEMMRECGGGRMKKGGRAERNEEIKGNAKSFGSKLGRSIGNAVVPGMTNKIVGKRIESGKFTAAHGGHMNREMLGERPSKKRPHFNYESDMMGAHAERKATHSSRIAKRSMDKSHHQYALGGHAMEKAKKSSPRSKVHNFAMGGVGKIRHGVSTKAGEQKQSTKVSRNNLF